MALFDSLFSLFNGDEEAQRQFDDSPEGFFEQQGLLNVTSLDIQNEMPRVLNALQGQSGDVDQGGLANFAGSGNVVLPPPPSAEAFAAAPDGGGLSGAVETLNHYNTVFNSTNQFAQDNDTTVIDDRDTTTDNSINNQVTAFGDVEQDFDVESNVASGDEAIAQSGSGTANSGDGALVAGDDLEIEDSTVATGNVGGSVTGDIEDSNVVGGDASESIIGSEIEDSSLAFGGGDSINDSQVLEGDGVLQNDIDGDANAANNSGSGDQTVVQDSELDESAVGGSVESNDVAIEADDGSAVAFGAGSDADSGDTNIDDVDGNVQVAGDGAAQAAANDESVEVEVEDSFNDQSVNTAIDDSFNDQSVEVEDSFQDNSSELEVEESFNDQSDDDVVDVG
jgi:hypothetical protein